MPEETAPPSLPLPKEALDDVSLVVKNADKLPRICEAVAGTEAVQSLAKLTGLVSAEIGLPNGEARAIVGTLLTLHRLRSQLGQSSEVFLAGLATWFAEMTKEEGKEELSTLWERGLPHIRDALGEDSAFATLDKATELVYSHQNVLREVRILTDLRPVYDKAASKIVRMVVTHLLRVDYLDGSSAERLYIAIDAGDLEKLEEQCTRAKDKAAVVAKSLENMPWPTSVIGENDE